MKYASLLLLFVIGLILCLSPYNPLLAQISPPSGSLTCGTTDLTPAQVQALKQQTMLALKRKMAARKSFTTITYVPIRPHIVRRSDGTDGLDMTSLNTLMAATNRHYLVNGLGIQFYFAGTTPDYINNDNFFGNFPFYDPSPIDGYDVSNALNQYYTQMIESASVAGYANFPANAITSTRSVITISLNPDYVGNHLIPHELGHTFGLSHTFGSGVGRTDEFVTRGAGANCETTGDYICDTPADPFINSNSNANLITDANGCPIYDPNSLLRDAHGDPYSPSITNIMSYYLPCTSDFTPSQYDNIQAALALRQSHTAYTLDSPATNVAPISNLAATSNGVSVLLTWQDNANNEMGYFIERSTSSTTNFVPIGGVAPDATTFRDNQTAPQTQYYYRIRPSNTTTNNLSSTVSIVTPLVPPVTGLTTSNIQGSSARLNWTSLGEGATYQVQWRPVGAANWNTVNTITESYRDLYSLNTNTTYEWQVRGIGGNAYSAPVTFLTSCPTPVNLTSSPARASASLTWEGTTNQLYTIQFRIAGTANWTTLSNLSIPVGPFNITHYSLTDLISSTAYEWRLQGVCPGSPAVSSDYTVPQSFTTGACNAPYFTSTSSAPGAGWVRFFWGLLPDEPTITAEIRYRPVGTTNWNTVSGLTSDSYTLTGLTNNTTYEWQLKNVCAAVESSVYTSLSTFTTSCRTPTSLLNTFTSKTATLSWYVSAAPDPGTTFTVQYRPAGNATWTTITGLTSSSCALTGLPAGTSYEWHVLTQCTANAQSDYSTIKTFTTGCNQLTTNNLKSVLITSSSAQLTWTVMNDPDTRYTILYRQVGTPNWTTISNLTASPTGGFYNLTGLSNNVQYEWQISTLCSDTQAAVFVAGPVFTTQCMTPTNLSSIPTFSSVSLDWKQMGVDVTYDVNYRRAGTTDWTTVNNLTTNSLFLTGLISNTQYEWQVRVHCNDGATTDFFAVQAYFTTQSCGTPSFGYPAVTNLTTTLATVNWVYSFADPNTPAEVRYRVVGTTSWTTITNLPTTNYSGNATLTGLTPTATYEWQVKALCSLTISSAFSASNTFQTLAPCSGMYTIKAGVWNDPTIWSCNRIPDNTDVVQIKHLVIIPVNYVANAYQIGFDSGQKLSYGTSAQLKVGL